MTFDSLEFRRALGQFVTGVTVVTTISEGKPAGFTANAFTSVSLDPPLALVCIGKKNTSLKAIQTSGFFAVNVMAKHQQDVAVCFASTTPEKYTQFCDAEYSAQLTGAPVINGCIAWFDCKLHSLIDSGDHFIVIGEVAAFGTNPGAPLVFAQGKYTALQN